MNDNYQVRCPVCHAEQDFRTRREADARAKKLEKRTRSDADQRKIKALTEALEKIQKWEVTKYADGTESAYWKYSRDQAGEIARAALALAEEPQ